MKDSQSLRIPAASAAKVGMAAALAAGMAIATPTAAFAAGEDQDVSVASENASDSYYYIGDSSYGLSTYLSEAVAQGSTKIHVGTSFTDKGTVTIPSSITELSGYSEGFFSSGPKTVDFGYSSLPARTSRSIALTSTSAIAQTLKAPMLRCRKALWFIFQIARFPIRLL